MATRTNNIQAKSEQTRAELLTSLATIVRGMPHQKNCNTVVPNPGPSVCSCFVGPRIEQLHQEMKALIVAATKD